jgi:hypothetical protein
MPMHELPTRLNHATTILKDKAKLRMRSGQNAELPSASENHVITF